MKAEFIIFFVQVARQKLYFRYNIVKMILHSNPDIKYRWNEFLLANDEFSFEASVRKYIGMEIREHGFLKFIECGNISDQEMKQIMDVHKMTDGNNLNPAYAYSEGELQYYYEKNFHNMAKARLKYQLVLS